jgi:hypothetical protein
MYVGSSMFEKWSISVQDKARLVLALKRAGQPFLDAGNDITPHQAQESWIATLNALHGFLTEEKLPPDTILALDQLTVALKATLQGDASRLLAPDDSASKGETVDCTLARASAAIDMLIRSGVDDELAAQQVTRSLICANVPLPEHGGDARGWKRLANWRMALRSGLRPREAEHLYREILAGGLPASVRGSDEIIRFCLSVRPESGKNVA